MPIQHVSVSEFHHRLNILNIASLGFVGAGALRNHILDCRDEFLPRHHANTANRRSMSSTRQRLL